MRTRRETLRAFALLLFRHLFFGLVILAFIIYLSFLGLDLAQGAPFRSGLDYAFGETLDQIAQYLQGDLGKSAAASITLRPIPLIEVVPLMFARSLALLGAALLFASLLGVSLGIRAARHRTSGRSLTIILTTIMGISVPSFFAALLLQMGVIRLTQFSGRTVLPVGGFGWDEHILLPALVLAARPLAQIARVTYVTIGENLDRDYVRTAYSKGLGARLVMLHHVLRNAAIPILTTIGLSLRFALSSLPVVEFFFGWPGVGFNLLKAVARQDTNLVVSLTLGLGALFILTNVLLDFSFQFIDPTLRESPTFMGREDRVSVWVKMKSLLTGLLEFFVGNPLRDWFGKREDESKSNPFEQISGSTAEEQAPAEFDTYRTRRLRNRLRRVLGNTPLILGSALVFGLVLVFFFGPRLAPHSPYAKQDLVVVDNKLSVPPFEPGEIHPWGTDVLGRDMMSLVLAGAQQTLFLAVLIVAARLVLGFALGALGGWLSGGWIDRLIRGLAEMFASFPTLILAMLFILALGIRQGFRPFIIALCLVGWGEIMEFVRGEVLVLRAKPFLEAAVAVGLRAPRMILSHILPNLVPALISLAALEMGAVLMLLGELGFIGIFLGGGAFAELDVFGAPYHYSDVPEWGALLSNVRTYARAYPWTAIYPSLAFFVAILAFNLFGEGLRRVVQNVGIGFARLVNRYTLALGLLAFFGIGWIQANTGAMAVYRLNAETFDGRKALEQARALAEPDFENRVLGTVGMRNAAEYIAGQFASLDLQPAGETFTFFQNRERSFEQLLATPQLSVKDGKPELTYRQDFVEYPGYYRNIGEVQGQVRFLALGDLTRSRTWGRGPFPALEDLDFSDEILLVLSEREAELLESGRVPSKGILVVSGDPAVLHGLQTLSPRDPNFPSIREEGDRPMFWVTEGTAGRILSSAGYDLERFRRLSSELGQDEAFTQLLNVSVSMDIQGEIRERVPVQHVIGHLPGISDSSRGGLDDRMIVVMAQYDTPPPVVGTQGASAFEFNEGASSLGMLLEIVHALQESEYQPYRTFLFVAYSGEGYEASGKFEPEVFKFLQAKHGFSRAFQLEAVVELRNTESLVQGGELLISTSSLRLADLFDETADWAGVPARRMGEQVELSVVFEDRSPQEGGEEAPYILLGWEGRASVSSQSSLESVDAYEQDLERIGQAISLALMTMGRERQY